MRTNKKIQEILRKNAEFEKEAPYNFCDRWCERCSHEKQIRCKLYQDKFEQKITCIAHGRNPNDPEITAEIMKKQYEDLEDRIEDLGEEIEINFDEIDDPEFEKIKEHIKFVENNPLPLAVEQYRKKAYAFLKDSFYKEKKIKFELTYDFETVAWYHTLLPVKLQRALAGFHEPVNEHEFALYDAVAQFEICKKAISKSIKALRNIAEKDKNLQSSITQLLALLHNMFSRIKLIEEGI